jgi:hypothetical protein
MPTRRLILLLAIALATLPACRRRSVLREPSTTPRITALESRVDVILGRTLVIPVSLEGAVNPARAIKARLDDGRSITVSLSWISVAPQPASLVTWIPDPGKWTATPAAAGARPSGTGSWVIIADLPADAMGQGLWLGRDRTALNWLPSPGFVKSREGPIDWSSPIGPLVQSPSLAQLAASESRSPIRRWRHRLLVGGLAPSDDPLAEAAPASDAFSDPVIEAFARQVEGRWQVALATLWMADPYVANLVKRRLANVIDFGNGTIAPAWPAATADLDALLADLLNVRLQPAQQVDRARAWLDTQPAAAAWIIDDAGQRDAMTGLTLGTIGAANLTERDTLGWTGVDSPDLIALPGFTAATILASGTKTTGPAPAPTRPTSPATPVEINVGTWSTTRSVMLDDTPALPPGIRLEPLRREWDMATWLAAGAPPPIEEAWTGAGMLYLNASDNTWNLYIECRSPTIGAEETIRIWLGAFGAPSSVIRIFSSGAVTDELAPRHGLPASVKGATVSRQGDTWSARIPVPTRCIEQDGTLRLGLERTDAMGRGTSWPRPMLPWQAEPGRIAVDTSAWGRLGAELAGSPGRPITPSSSTR